MGKESSKKIQGLRMNKFISIIPLRKGSKGIKNKNTKLLNGIPLYIYTINQSSRLFEKCIVNTNIEEILNKKFTSNIDTFKREEKYSGDKTSMQEVLNDLFCKLNLVDYNAVLLQATSPLRSDQDIINAINLYKTKQYSLVLSVKATEKNVLKYGIKKNNFFKPLHKKSLFKNRQELPKVLSPNGAIYVFSIKDFLKYKDFPSNKIGFYEMPLERSIDIDNIEDFRKVSKIIKKIN